WARHRAAGHCVRAVRARSGALHPRADVRPARRRAAGAGGAIRQRPARGPFVEHGSIRCRDGRHGGPGADLEEASMYYETSKNDHGLRYNPLKACVVPRPIGWITTIDAAGAVNLAPFSFFNLLSYDPPFVMFSAGAHEVDGGRKDTVVNVAS